MWGVHICLVFKHFNLFFTVHLSFPDTFSSGPFIEFPSILQVTSHFRSFPHDLTGRLIFTLVPASLSHLLTTISFLIFLFLFSVFCHLYPETDSCCLNHTTPWQDRRKRQWRSLRQLKCVWRGGTGRQTVTLLRYLRYLEIKSPSRNYWLLDGLWCWGENFRNYDNIWKWCDVWPQEALSL